MARLGTSNKVAVCLTALLMSGAGHSVAAAVSLPSTVLTAASALQTSADLGHGDKISRAASAPGGPIVPEGCRNFGHWVSSEARGTTCQEDPRPKVAERGGNATSGGPTAPEGCRNHGHWVSSQARGTTCQDNPRPSENEGSEPQD